MRIRSTTIVAVRKDGHVALAGDGQVTLGDHAIKHTARKVLRLLDGKVLAGFAGGAADALSLLDRVEQQIRETRIRRGDADGARLEDFGPAIARNDNGCGVHRRARRDGLQRESVR